MLSGEKVKSSTFHKLLIPEPIFAAMLAQAVQESPLECCGLLSGRRIANCDELRIETRYPLVNALASPIAYESDPRSMFNAVKDMRRNGTDVLAVYHSHPNDRPFPSRRDLEQTYSERVVNLIISLQAAQPEVRGWWQSEWGFREACWQVI